MWPFDTEKDKEILDLKKQLERLEDDYDDLQRENRNLTKVIDTYKSETESLNHDFNFESVHKIISIEFTSIERSALLKCTVCYMVIEPVIAESNIKSEPVYREWYCVCTVDQYKYLYSKYLEYKEKYFK